ncbi:FAD binding domain-containing protein [Hoeflea sp. WL0058]|uniref:FAD binding domain-containing protein n=1 Tax=Flavimaribacter sediminis TaxID=2865987 RepID=A0AAE2ZR87_9HYPH|nr:FAD binding domain-containing protein [Flavimaribacter sediminis]MBW8638132.1 FAD binding domain-containing protein [Flavimaribacter sediminis]
MDYYRPDKTEDALSWLASRVGQSRTIAAGCTDLLAATPNSSLSGPVLDLTGVNELRGIVEQPNAWRIGAATTWTDIIRHPLPPAFDALKLAAREVGSVQIQNAATVAGNLCNASPAADGAPCLLGLDASVEIASIAGVRTLPLAEFIEGPRQTALRPDEIVSAIVIPKTAACGVSTFLKLGARKYLVISIAMVAARLVIEAGVVSDAAIAVGACSPVARRLDTLETRLKGQPANAALASLATDELVAESLSPIDDVRADAAYRSHSAAELVRRAIVAIATPGAEIAA